MAKKPKKQLEKQENLVLIYGNQYTVDETVRKIRKQVKSDEVVRIDAEDSTLQSLTEALCYEDMFASRKLILVRGMPSEDAKTLIPLWQRIPKNNFVVFYSYSSLKAKKNICKFFKEYAKLIEYDIEVKDVDKIITQIAKSYGKSVEKDALDLMTEYLGNHVGIIKAEIEKLCNYVGEKEEIEIEDVRAICCLSREFVIWDLVRHVGDKNIAKAITALSSAIDSGYTYEFVVLMLMRSIRLGIFLRELDAEDMSIWDMTTKIKEYKKTNGSFVYKDYEVRKTYDARSGFYASFSLWELCHSLQSCHEAFLSIRKAYKKEEQEKELSMLLFAICFPSCFTDQGERT